MRMTSFKLSVFAIVISVMLDIEESGNIIILVRGAQKQRKRQRQIEKQRQRQRQRHKQRQRQR